jgi:hypothetical protein
MKYGLWTLKFHPRAGARKVLISPVSHVSLVFERKNRSIMTSIHSSDYRLLRQAEDGIDQPASISQRHQTLFSYMGWIVASIFALSTIFLMRSPPATSHASVASFGTGFSTEFDPIKPHIKAQPTMFWGGPRWYDNGTGYRLHNPSEPIYVGPPTTEIDMAWDIMLKNRYFTVTEQEAEMAFGKPHGLYNHSDGVGYLVGLDVLHTLHCVNELRKALDRSHYYNKETKLAFPDRGHRDHCLDHIRQQLMCHADMTPIPVIWYEGHGRSFVQSDVVHTCRDWDALHRFISTRSG